MLTLLRYRQCRGALFGVDARLALAIFTGLAVISGAIIYKTAGKSRQTAEIAEMRNIAKAFGDYIADVGQAPAQIEDLISSSASGWNGPYVPYVDLPSLANNSVSFQLAGRSYGASIGYYADSVWFTDTNGSAPCIAGNCWAWLQISNAEWTSAQIQALDEAIDGSLDGERGNLRFETGAGDGTSVMLRIGSVRTAGY